MPAVAEATSSTAATAAASKVTAVALRASWQFLIPSYGLTLIYLNFHFLARYLGSSRKFCEFGSEWNPRTIVTGKANFGLKYAEMLALIFLDALVILVLLAIATLLAMFVYLITHPCDFIGLVGYDLAFMIGGFGGFIFKAGCAVLTSVTG